MSDSRAVRVLASCLLAAGVFACGPASRPPRAPLRTPATRSRAVTFVVPPLDAPRLLARDSTGMLAFAVGGVRVRLSGHDAEAASQPFASPLAGAGKLGARWWFVSARGTVASAAEYLDNVTFERDLGVPVARAFVRDNVLVAVLADGRVVRADPTPGVDAGASFLVPLPAASSSEPATPGPTDADVSLVAETALRRFPFARMVLPSMAVLPSGELVVQGYGAVYFTSPRPDGSLQTAARVVLGAQVPGPCALQAWGSRALLTCSTGTATDGALAPFVVDRNGATRVGPSAPGALLVGREGHTLTRLGACPEAEASSSPPPPPSVVAPEENATLACTLDRDRDWREWQYPYRAQILDVFDATALVLDRRDAGAQLRYYDIDMGRGVDVRLDDPTAEIARAGFTRDGHIVVLAHAGGGRTRRSLIGIGTPGRTIDLRPVGFYVHDLDFADARMGLAAGENAGDLAETRDGGLTWLHVDGLALDGDPRSFPLFPPAARDESRTRRVNRLGTDVHCAPTLCVVGSHVVHTWDRTAELVPAMP